MCVFDVRICRFVIIKASEMCTMYVLVVWMAYHITYILQIKLRDNIVRTATLMYVTVTKYHYIVCEWDHLTNIFLHHGQRTTCSVRFSCFCCCRCSFLHSFFSWLFVLGNVVFFFLFFFAICRIFMLVAHKYFGSGHERTFSLNVFNNKIKK